MDEQTLDHFKLLFLGLKKNNILNEANLDSNLQLSQRGDDIDKIIEDRDKHMLLKLQGRQKFFQKKVDLALERIKLGDFGICSACEDEIELSRLYARPTATQCIACKEENERVEEHIPYQRRSHTLGKSIISNGNVIDLPIHGEEINKEKVLKFRREKISIGLKQ